MVGSSKTEDSTEQYRYTYQSHGRGRWSVSLVPEAP